MGPRPSAYTGLGSASAAGLGAHGLYREGLITVSACLGLGDAGRQEGLLREPTRTSN